MTSLLEIHGLEIDLGDERHPTHVLRGVELEIAEGEVVGLVGESGSGKTTTMLSVAGLLARSARIRGGTITLAGRDLLRLSRRDWRSVRGREVACVFQNARGALHPMMSIGDQIARLHRLHRDSEQRVARREAITLLERVGLSDAEQLASRCPHELSGGQCQRAMIAMALVGRPKLLLADEPTSGLDVTVQRQVLQTLIENGREHGTAMLLISHDFGVVRRTSDRVSVMYAGEVVEAGPRGSVLGSPAHPYTQALIANLAPRGRRMSFIPGQVPDLRQPIGACAFADRCPRATAECRRARPADVAVGSGHDARCIHTDQALAKRPPIAGAMC